MWRNSLVCDSLSNSGVAGAIEVVRQVLSAVEAGRDEVLADDMTRQVKAGLSDREGIYLNFDPLHEQPTNSNNPEKEVRSPRVA